MIYMKKHDTETKIEIHGECWIDEMGMISIENDVGIVTAPKKTHEIFDAINT